VGAWGLGVALLFAPVGSPRSEPPPPVDVSWDAPAQCPDRDAFVAAVAELVGHELTIVPEAQTRVRGRVTRTGSGFSLALEIATPTGTDERAFEATKCGSLVDVGSLVVATRLLDDSAPAATEREPQSVAVPEPVTSPASEQPVVEAAPVEATEAPPTEATRPASPAAVVVQDDPAAVPRRRAVRGAFALLGGVASGVLPGAFAVVRAEPSVLGDQWRASMVAQWGRSETREPEGAGVRVQQLGGGLRGCWVPTIGPIEALACSGVDLAVLFARGIGDLDETERTQQLWVGVPLGAGLGWSPWRWFALRATVEMSIALRKPGFHVMVDQSRVTLFRSAAVGVFGGAAVEVRFP